YWSHKLYFGPEGETVKIHYSKTKSNSEAIAQLFLNEEVLGFDMEWPSDPRYTSPRLQSKVGLIQVAKETQIALFHIGMHPGSTPDELIAPSLRKIIESPNIIKAGVSILQSDSTRLENHFGLKPQGLFELSHLYNLVKYGATDPSKVTTRFVALAKQVEEHFLLPLSKSKVRTSNWSRQLNQDQIHYAAADAYAGFMLFHCMDAKRRLMDPMPPLPAHAELRLPIEV
ncbi:ribonuclease H-like protein, partial [Lepidopterella palustris CBS 459.81]